MKNEFEVRILIRRLPLSRASVRTLRNVRHYDRIIFTSNHAKRIFMAELRKRRISLPHNIQVTQVGPRKDLLKFSFANERILFPRSALAPRDIIKKLRARGATVRTLTLYTATGVPLSSKEREGLLSEEIRQLYFKSPSGIAGLLKQMQGAGRQTVLAIPARCIGETTAAAARKAKFKRVFIA